MEHSSSKAVNINLYQQKAIKVADPAIAAAAAAGFVITLSTCSQFMSETFRSPLREIQSLSLCWKLFSESGSLMFALREAHLRYLRSITAALAGHLGTAEVAAHYARTHNPELLTGPLPVATAACMR